MDIFEQHKIGQFSPKEVMRSTSCYRMNQWDPGAQEWHNLSMYGAGGEGTMYQGTRSSSNLQTAIVIAGMFAAPYVAGAMQGGTAAAPAATASSGGFIPGSISGGLAGSGGAVSSGLGVGAAMGAQAGTYSALGAGVASAGAGMGGAFGAAGVAAGAAGSSSSSLGQWWGKMSTLQKAKTVYSAGSTAYSAYKNAKANEAMSDYGKSEAEARRAYEEERLNRIRNGPLAKLAPYLMQQALGIYGMQMGDVGGGFDAANMQKLMGVRNEDLEGMPAFTGWFPGQGQQQVAQADYPQHATQDEETPQEEESPQEEPDQEQPQEEDFNVT